MNKKLLTAIFAATLIVPSTANAAFKTEASIPTPTLAILDTALDTSIPAFQGRIAYEVCILEWNSCPNGKSYMEGTGSAVLPKNIIINNGFDHGTMMTSIALENNPNMNVVFVRIIGNTLSGTRQITNEITIANALDWVYNNKSKFNIQAVALAQGHHNLTPLADYCPNTPNTKSKISNLISVGVPTFIASGNGRDYKKIDWPSCIDEAISVGATSAQDEITIYSNVDINRLDFVALGNTTAIKPLNFRVSVAGTSASTQIAAASWIALKQAKPGLSYTEQLELFTKTSSKVIGPKGTYGKLINLKVALNG